MCGWCELRITAAKAKKSRGVPGPPLNAGAGTPRYCRYIAKRSLDSEVPIWPNVVMICPALVSRKNLPASLAQFCSSVEVASPPVLTCTA